MAAKRNRKSKPADQIELDLWGFGEADADQQLRNAVEAPPTPTEAALLEQGTAHHDQHYSGATKGDDEQVRISDSGQVAGDSAAQLADSRESTELLLGAGGADAEPGIGTAAGTADTSTRERRVSGESRTSGLAAEAGGRDRDERGGLADERTIPRQGGVGVDQSQRAGADHLGGLTGGPEAVPGPAGGDERPVDAADSVLGTVGNIQESFDLFGLESGDDGNEPNRTLEARHEPVATRFVPSTQEALAPSGAKARFLANVQAIRLSREIEASGRQATPAEQDVLARWSSWGALPDIFDEGKLNWASERDELRQILTEKQYSEARRTTINAHYTDPAYAREIWHALAELGFDKGTVLEPGAGAGTFIGLAPSGAQMVGVELDSTTASITRALYPAADVKTESFADTRFPADYFDATVGNVPFANVALHDPVHNGGRHSIHNHFIIKSLSLTRPGGIVAVLTSHYTLDAQNPAARREMNALGDLLGAVRLPSGAHRRSAGTEAVTDLLIFRRRETNTPPADTSWETVSAVDVNGQALKVNSYFTWRPNHVLGEMAYDTGMYGSETLYVRGDLATTPIALKERLAEIVSTAREQGQTFSERSFESEQRRAAYIPAESTLWDGTIVAQAANTFTIVRNGGHEPLAVPKSATRELRALIGLRDSATALLDAEAATIEDNADVLAARSTLRERYASYQTTYGPLNRFTLRNTGRVDPETKEPKKARITPRPITVFRNDPFSSLVMALERFDESTQKAAPAAILNQRVVMQRPTTKGVDTPSEAIAHSLDKTGTIELSTIAHMLGESEESARELLDDLVYDDPATGDLVHAPQYLSGDVRQKLEIAREAALTDDRFNINVSALERVLPRTLGSDEIHAKLGAVWIDAKTHQAFLQEILNDSSIRVENPLPGDWAVRGSRQSIKATSEWGTERRPAPDIAAAAMSQRPLTVYDDYEEFGRTFRVLNPIETTAAQEKATLLQERFADWVWEDPERANQLAAEYNRRFNSIVLRDYSESGKHLTLPGLAANFVPQPHQRDAVARAIAEPTAGLFHAVGAGKTAEMVMASMEQVRMGLIKKPAVVVPNHMLEQFGREWLQLYPQAKILAASTDDLTGEKRRLFVARAAANDWDAIIMTRTAFERIPLSPAAEQAYLDKEVDELRTALESAKDEGMMSVKRIERAVLSAEQQHKKLLDKPRDPGISFESTGIDYLVVDELHDYKNLMIVSKIPDAGKVGSNRATDLHMKLEYLRSQHGSRVITGATATPLANSVTEAYVMQRFMRPELLEAAGIGNFDAWAATFGEVVTDMEMAPTGNGNFKLKSRFSKFNNVPELLRMWHVFADVKSAEDLNLPTPALRARADGTRAAETIVIPPTPELEKYMEEIGERAERVANKSVEPKEDNMLKITGDGRKASLDMRLVRAEEPTSTTKIDVMASRIADEWRASRDNEYVDVLEGEPSKIRGGIQLVFLDLGTPNAERWNAYDELKLRLVDRGMPADAIRYIHEARNDSEKARIFASARAGHIAVLVGSTQKMGVGTNVQARMTAIHHGDVPWRPADIEQRDGRGVRQGNQNAEIAIRRYVVERSLDAFLWQAVERKARFIAQLMKGDLETREIEDIGDTAMSAAEAKALSSGNPLLLEKANADNDLSRLERLERAYQRNLVNLGHTRSRAAELIDKGQRDLLQLQDAAGRVVDTAGDAFEMTVDHRTFTSRADASSAIARWGVNNSMSYLSRRSRTDFGTMGTIGGFDVRVESDPGLSDEPYLAVRLEGVPRSSLKVSRNEFLEGGLGLVRQLENRASAVPRLIAEIEQEDVVLRSEIEEADARLSAPFAHSEALSAARHRQRSVNDELAAQQAESEAPKVQPADADSAVAIASMGFHRPAHEATSGTAQPGRARPDSSDDDRASEVTR